MYSTRFIGSSEQLCGCKVTTKIWNIQGFRHFSAIFSSIFSLLADDIDYPYGNKLPLWIIGFLY